MRVFVPELFLLPNRCSQAVEILDVNRNGSFRSQVPFSPVTLALGDSGVASGSGVGRCQWLVGKCRAARATINRYLPRYLGTDTDRQVVVRSSTRYSCCCCMWVLLVGG